MSCHQDGHGMNDQIEAIIAAAKEWREARTGLLRDIAEKVVASEDLSQNSALWTRLANAEARLHDAVVILENA